MTTRQFLRRERLLSPEIRRVGGVGRRLWRFQLYSYTGGQVRDGPTVLIPLVLNLICGFEVCFV